MLLLHSSPSAVFRPARGAGPRGGLIVQERAGRRDARVGSGQLTRAEVVRQSPGRVQGTPAPRWMTEGRRSCGCRGPPPEAPPVAVLGDSADSKPAAAR